MLRSGWGRRSGALTFFAILAASRSSYAVALSCFALGGYLAWWLLEFLGRNRPHRFDPAAYPPPAGAGVPVAGQFKGIRVETLWSAPR